MSQKLKIEEITEWPRESHSQCFWIRLQTSGLTSTEEKSHVLVISYSHKIEMFKVGLASIVDNGIASLSTGNDPLLSFKVNNKEPQELTNMNSCPWKPSINWTITFHDILESFQ